MSFPRQPCKGSSVVSLFVVEVAKKTTEPQKTSRRVSVCRGGVERTLSEPPATHRSVALRGRVAEQVSVVLEQ